MSIERSIDPNSTLSEIVRRYPAARGVFNAHGLDTCCGGGLPVAEAARRHGLDLAAGLGRQPWMTAAAARVAEDLVLPAGTTAQLLGESGWDHITLIARATGRLSLTAAETTMIERHGISCRARHRALGDAEALWQFLQLAAREHGEEILAVAARQVARQPALPPYIDRAAVDAIPEAPGVYLFYGEAAPPLYIGESRSMRSRVLQHLCSPAAWTRRVRRIEWQRTAGELGALLREASLVRELDPVFNRQLRRPRQFEPADWPHRGPLGILETDPARDATEVHVVDRWCYLGTASCDPEVAELLEAREPRFDYDHYRILARHLRKRGVRVVQLGY